MLLSIRNLFLTSLLLAIFTFPILTPSKIYPLVTIQYASAFDILNKDYIQTYGLFLPNILILLMLFSLIAVLPHSKLSSYKRYKTIVFTIAIGFILFLFLG